MEDTLKKKKIIVARKIKEETKIKSKKKIKKIFEYLNED